MDCKNKSSNQNMAIGAGICVALGTGIGAMLSTLLGTYWIALAACIGTALGTAIGVINSLSHKFVIFHQALLGLLIYPLEI